MAFGRKAVSRARVFGHHVLCGNMKRKPRAQVAMDEDDQSDGHHNQDENEPAEDEVKFYLLDVVGDQCIEIRLKDVLHRGIILLRM